MLLLLLIACTPEEIERPHYAGDDTGRLDGQLAIPYTPSYCYAVAANGPTLDLLEIDPTAGTWSVIGGWPLAGVGGAFRTGASAWDGTSLALVNLSTLRWMRFVPGVDEATVAGGTDAWSVTWDGGSYWTARLDGLVQYASFDDMAADSPSSSIALTDHYVEQITAGDDAIFGAWHSTDHVEVFNAAGTYTRTVPLDRWDTWVWGMSYSGGALYLLDDGREAGEVRVAWFDTNTGEQLGRVLLTGHATVDWPAGFAPGALTCTTDRW